MMTLKQDTPHPALHPYGTSHEWLDQNIFESIKGAQDQATQWLWTYNTDRTNMAIGGITLAMKLKRQANFKDEHSIFGGSDESIV